LSDQPVATARTGWRLGRTLLIAAVLAGLAVVLFATSAFSGSSRSPGSTGGTPGYEQVQQTPGQGDQGRDCPNKSGRDGSNDPSSASLDV
jgi:hypothetical protein